MSTEESKAPQMKMDYSPAFYSFTATPRAVFETILALRKTVAELEVSDDTKALLALLEEGYVGDLPEPIGEPLKDEDGNVVILDTEGGEK